MGRCSLLFLVAYATACAQDPFPQDLQAGLQLVQAGKYHEALEPLGRAVLSRPAAFEPNYLLGLALSQDGRVVAAIRHLRTGQRTQPRHTGLLVLLGVLYLQEGYALDAAETLAAAGRIGPLDEKPALLAAEAWHRCFRFDKALASATDTAARFPRSADAQFRVGYELETAGRFDEAQSAFANAVELRPNFVEARVALARLHRRFGRYDSAGQHLQMALMANPKHSQARLELAKLSAGRKENVRARELLEGLIAESDSEPELHLLLSRVFQEEGNAAGSIRERERFQQLSRTEGAGGGMSGTVSSGKSRRFDER